MLWVNPDSLGVTMSTFSGVRLRIPHPSVHFGMNWSCWSMKTTSPSWSSFVRPLFISLPLQGALSSYSVLLNEMFYGILSQLWTEAGDDDGRWRAAVTIGRLLWSTLTVSSWNLMIFSHLRSLACSGALVVLGILRVLINHLLEIFIN